MLLLGVSSSKYIMILLCHSEYFFKDNSTFKCGNILVSFLDVKQIFIRQTRLQFFSLEIIGAASGINSTQSFQLCPKIDQRKEPFSKWQY